MGRQLQQPVSEWLTQGFEHPLDLSQIKNKSPSPEVPVKNKSVPVSSPMLFLDHPLLILIVGVLSFPVYMAFAKIFWGEKFESLGETLRALIDPFYGFRKGKAWAEWDAKIQTLCFIMLCAAWTAAITELLARYFP